jgi:CRP/FNR family transcriptional regulator, nitrogen fixation regulation protein
MTNDPSREVSVIAIRAKFGASETSYAKDVEIYRAGERAGRVYEVIHGAVRSYKVLSDGRRQICSFHLPNAASSRWSRTPTNSPWCLGDL